MVAIDVLGHDGGEASPLLERGQGLVVGGEIYQALDKGIIDGCTSDYEMSESRRIYEVTTSVVSNFYIGHGQFYMIMNQGVWDGLPEDVKRCSRN